LKKNGCYLKRLPEGHVRYTGDKHNLVAFQNEIKLKNILVPLKNIQYRVEIVNSLAHITLIQKYFNPIDKFVEMDYSFPINPKSCVYRFVAEFGTTKIEGIVK
jgi:hypothetical protein